MTKKKAIKQCEFVKDSGERCRARPLIGSRLCFFHDPDKASALKAAKQKGGRARKAATLPKETPDFEIKSADDVVALLSETISQVRRGEVDPKVANAVGYLSGIILRARDQGDIEERIVELETAIKSNGRGKDARFRPSA